MRIFKIPHNTISIVAILALLLPALGIGQDREFHYYGDELDEFIGTFLNADGTLAICGHRRSDDERWIRRLWFTIIDVEGEVVLNQDFGDDQYGSGIDLIEIENGGHLIGGYSQPERYQRGFLVVRLDNEGEVVWSNEYEAPEEGFNHNTCFDVIELKSGDFVLAGEAEISGQYRMPRKAWIMRIDPDGEIIWSRLYNGNEEGQRVGMSGAYSILESGNNIIGGGEIVYRGAWLFAVSQDDGDIVWEHVINYGVRYENPALWGMFNKLVSANGEYFAFGYAFDSLNPGDPELVRYPLVKYHGDGERLSETFLELMPIGEYPNIFTNRVRDARAISSGGFVLTVRRNRFNVNPNASFADVIRIGEFGETIWEDTLDYVNNVHSLQVVDDKIIAFGNLNYRREPYNAFFSTITDHTPPFFHRAGHGNEQDYDRENPEDREGRGNGFAITVLQGDIVRFWVEAADRQEDEIAYEWQYNEEIISDSLEATVEFDELGQFEVICRITDDEGETMDSLWWRVNVVELYIVSYFPDETYISVARGQDLFFAIEEVRSLEGRDLTYNWVLNGEMVSDDDEYTLVALDEFDPQVLIASVSNGNAADSVVWNIQLQSLFRSWQPAGDMISTAVGSSVRFEVVLQDGLREGETPFWIVEGDTLAIDTLAMQFEFVTEGQTSVQLAVMSQENRIESVEWLVDVTPLFVNLDQSPLPMTAFLEIKPNPFNSTTMISYSVPVASRISLKLYNLSGREVLSLIDGEVKAGVHRTILAADDLTSGVYFIRMKAAEQVFTRKLALLK